MMEVQMSVSVYAAFIEEVEGLGKVVSPIIPFKHHNPEVRNPSMSYEEWMLYDGDDAMVPNPHYISSASMDLANGNAEHLFQALGFNINTSEGGTNLDLDLVHKAVLKGLNGKAVERTRETVIEKNPGRATMYNMGVDRDRMTNYLTRLLEIVVEGRKRGSKIIAVA